MNYSIRQLSGLDPVDIDGNGDPVYLDHVAYPSVDPREGPAPRYGTRAPMARRGLPAIEDALDALIADLELLGADTDIPF